MSEAINGSSPQKDAPSARFASTVIPPDTDEGRFDRGATRSPGSVIRYARRHLGFLAGLVIAAVAVGVVYRYLFDPLEERTLSYNLRSSVHAIGLTISG